MNETHSGFYESNWDTGAYVIPPFDIFRMESHGHLVWQGIAETLDVARLHIKILMVGEPGDYIIHSQKTGHETIVKADGTTERIA